MTCKDCICFDACMDYTKLKESEFAQNFDEMEKLCDHFKNKADFVEVVRCKDCAFRVPIDDKQFVYNGKPAMHCIMHTAMFGENDYCSDGRKRDP